MKIRSGFVSNSSSSSFVVKVSDLTKHQMIKIFELTSNWKFEWSTDTITISESSDVKKYLNDCNVEYEDIGY